MLLENKTAVIYGGGGAIGSAVARAFAREGARVFLAGRTLARLEAAAAGEAAEVDALDENAVEAHIESVEHTAGAIDILFHCVGMQDVQGIPLLEMRVEDFLRPIAIAARAGLLTARAVGRRMAQRGSGVILTITAGPPEALPYLGGFGAACAALEGLWRGLAAELGPRGVRVVCLHSPGSPDTPDVQAVFELHARAAGVAPQELLARVAGATLLRRLPSSAEIANVAAMMASDGASAITGAFIPVTCGSPAGDAASPLCRDTIAVK